MQEYGRYFDMPTVCFRGGCLTGPQHAGAQLHGFLAYLMKCTVTGTPYTVFGYGGKQVRDNIHSADLVACFQSFQRAPRAGAVYNMGGGRRSNCSMLEAIDVCERISGRELQWELSDDEPDRRPPLVDLRRLRLRRRLPRLAAALRHRRDPAGDVRAERRALDGDRGLRSAGFALRPQTVAAPPSSCIFQGTVERSGGIGTATASPVPTPVWKSTGKSSGDVAKRLILMSVTGWPPAPITAPPGGRLSSGGWRRREPATQPLAGTTTRPSESGVAGRRRLPVSPSSGDRVRARPAAR